MSIRVLFVLFQCVLSALVEGSITDSHHTSLRATDVSKLTLFFRNQSEVGFSRAHNTIPPNNEVKQLYKDTHRKVGNYQLGVRLLPCLLQANMSTAPWNVPILRKINLTIGIAVFCVFLPRSACVTILPNPLLIWQKVFVEHLL